MDYVGTHGISKHYFGDIFQERKGRILERWAGLTQEIDREIGFTFIIYSLSKCIVKLMLFFGSYN